MSKTKGIQPVKQNLGGGVVGEGVVGESVGSGGFIGAPESMAVKRPFQHLPSNKKKLTPQKIGLIIVKFEHSGFTIG